MALDACLQVVPNPVKDFVAIAIEKLYGVFVKKVDMGTEVKCIVQRFGRCWECGWHLGLVKLLKGQRQSNVQLIEYDYMKLFLIHWLAVYIDRWTKSSTRYPITLNALCA